MQTTFTTSGSIVIHGVILAGFLGASLFYVEPLAEPIPQRIPVESLIDIRLPPAAAASAPPPLAAGGEISDETNQETAPDQAQPQETPPTIPRPEGAGGGPGTDGVEGGVRGGIRGGIPGGVPDGVPWGILGGRPDGFPGSPLDGLPDGDQPVHLTGEIRAPERISFVKPEYPDLARRVRAEGKVILEIVVGRTGSIEEVKVLRSNPLFDLAAVEAVRKWKYRPALQSGREVTVYLTVVVSFELQ